MAKTKKKAPVKNKTVKKTTKKKNPVGRPPFVVDAKIIKEVETYASLGFKKNAIAKLLGISYETYNERAKEFPEFSDAFDIGKLKGIVVVASSMMREAKDGNVTAGKYILNNLGKADEVGGWTERQEVSLKSPEGITFINHYGGKPDEAEHSSE